ncbi:MAG: class I SAM-dependent methyltransferase [Flavobacteriaceae bacterium]
MKKDFDHIANKYDTDFTYSEIGKRQRKSVYKYLNKLPNNLSVLELNCGTGEDAIWFANKGNTVLATDISLEMIKVGEAKVKGIDNIKFQQLDINILNKTEILPVVQNDKTNTNIILTERGTSDKESQKFDLIFSNFGGLNCLNATELKIFFANAKELLNLNGKLILCYK